MKKMTCEMCGSTDLIKQDGVFVCQVCGCKYSTEEARKMMIEGVVEVTGTVKVDNSAAINNYLNMARNALKAGNEQETESYCDKIIEIDTTSWEAWYLKGCAVGWQSTLANSRISETLNCYSNALQYCPDEQKEELKVDCKNELDRINTAIIALRMKNIKDWPSESNIAGLVNDITRIILSSTFMVKSRIKMCNNEHVKFAKQINIGFCDAWKVSKAKYETSNDGHPIKMVWKNFTAEGDSILKGFEQALALVGTEYDDGEGNALIIQIYENMITIEEYLINSCSFKIEYSNGYSRYVKDWFFADSAKNIRRGTIQDWKNSISNVKTIGPQKVMETENRRREAYWAEHQDLRETLEKEKQTLEQEKADLDRERKVLYQERESVPSALIVKDFKDRIDSITREKNGLGLFKSKEKKALQSQIESLEREMAPHQEDLKMEQAAVDKKIEPLNSRISSIARRIIAINTEFAQNR